MAAPSRSRGCRTSPARRAGSSSGRCATRSCRARTTWYAERHVAGDGEAAVCPVGLHGGEHAVDGRKLQPRRCASAARGPRIGCPRKPRDPEQRRADGCSPTVTGCAASASPSSRSMYPSRPSVLESIGCTLERASIHTRSTPGRCGTGKRGADTAGRTSLAPRRAHRHSPLPLHGTVAAPRRRTVARRSDDGRRRTARRRFSAASPAASAGYEGRSNPRGCA